MQCSDCKTEMKLVTLREWIDMWTGYTCPGCCLAIREADAVEVEDTPEPKKRKRKAGLEVTESEGGNGW